MWISALFGMMTKFAEIALAVRFRYRSENGEWIGGPMVYLERGFGSRGLAVLYAVLCTLASLGLGCGTQANSIAGAFQTTFGIDVRITGILLVLASAAVILGGVRRIGKVTEKLVPFMTLAYVLGGLFLIILNASNLPGAFRSVLSGAFSFRAAGGGVGGYVFAQAMRFGVSRGVFTNEAGLGSSAIAHASADTNEPVRQAMWGCFEVFTDTLVMCTVTAFVILSAGLDLSSPYESGVALSIAAFATGFGVLPASSFRSC
jgi:AGCS family alanine or glycine:cation symporter